MLLKKYSISPSIIQATLVSKKLTTCSACLSWGKSHWVTAKAAYLIHVLVQQFPGCPETNSIKYSTGIMSLLAICNSGTSQVRDNILLLAASQWISQAGVCLCFLNFWGKEFSSVLKNNSFCFFSICHWTFTVPAPTEKIINNHSSFTFPHAIYPFTDIHSIFHFSQRISFPGEVLFKIFSCVTCFPL